ncbi:MAG TPA: penicillin acylase family protein, partial [Thermoanaerobaculia bacterium]|nr:penicillin acylase family protein [Thermoanaerobaculia bacterium]
MSETPDLSRRRRLPGSVRIAAWTLGIVLILALALLVTGSFRLRGSLPALDGDLDLAGLSAPVTIERDSLGVPTVRASNRLDAARALGFLHGQDRFFQMDLLRRQPAGELSELFGGLAYDSDRTMKLHRFRYRAERAIETGSEPQRRILEAYTAGVNSGLTALDDLPFEYILLRVEPVPWRLEDSILVLYAM